MLRLIQTTRCPFLASPGQPDPIGAQQTDFPQIPPEIIQVLDTNKLGQSGQHSMVPGVYDTTGSDLYRQVDCIESSIFELFCYSSVTELFAIQRRFDQGGCVEGARELEEDDQTWCLGLVNQD